MQNRKSKQIQVFLRKVKRPLEDLLTDMLKIVSRQFKGLHHLHAKKEIGNEKMKSHLKKAIQGY